MFSVAYKKWKKDLKKWPSQSKMTSSSVLFCPNNIFSPMISKSKKQLILTVENSCPLNFCWSTNWLIGLIYRCLSYFSPCRPFRDSLNMIASSNPFYIWICFCTFINMQKTKTKQQQQQQQQIFIFSWFCEMNLILVM